MADPRQNRFDAWLRPGRGPDASELLAVASLLLVAGLLAYGSYVIHGGFYADDWSNAAGYHFSDSPKYWNTVSDLTGELGGRPLLAVLLPIPHAVFGVHPGPQLALAVALGVITSWCLYLALRTLSMAPVHAAAISVLALLFPWSDAIRLWATASVNSVAVILFLFGLVLALHGLRRRGRAGLAMHAGADLLYLLSVLTYEVAAAAALLAGFLYLGRAPLASVGRRWLADIAVVFAALLYSLETTVSARHVGSLSERLGDIGDFLREGALLLASALLPLDSLGRPVQALVLVVAAAIAGAALLRLRRRESGELRGWLRWIAIGLVTIAAAYFMFLGSHLHPRDPGIDTRINLFAGLGYCILVYALLAAASELLLGPGRRAAVLSAGAALLVAVGYGLLLRDDESDWRRASDLQDQVLAAVDADLPALPRDSTVLTFGHPSHAAPEVPVFNKGWDLRGALRLHTGDPTLRAYPIFRDIAVSCARHRLEIAGPPTYGRFTAPYGRLFELDVGAGSARRVTSEAACRRALPALRRRAFPAG